ncbi:MAG: hypothetical protein IMZ55_12775 [Acidobacteria bacterium]|nr:hypothetical protein [Acidobacteriota bacterium]
MREALQDLHDQRREPRGEVAAHLAICRECSRFNVFLGRLGADALASIEAPLASLPAPDVAAVIRRGQAQGRAQAPLLAWFATPPHPLQAAAAALVVGIGIAAGLLAYGGCRERQDLRASMSAFVDGLFSSSALDGAEFGSPALPSGLDALVADAGD